MKMDLGGLSKPAVVLIQRISDAVGGIAKPWQIVRVAKATAEGERIKHLNALEMRAVDRFITEEVKRQQNIEAIARKAVPIVGTGAKPEEIEDDWITNFFEKCRTVSDDQVQNLWARILAGEANSPGGFSRKTVNLLADLGKGEAELFTAACGFVWQIGYPTLLMFGYKNEIYRNQGMSFDTLSHLQALGLLQLKGGTETFYRGGLFQNAGISYFGRTLALKFSHETDNTLMVGDVLLTRMGVELATVAGGEPIEGFFEFVYDRLAGQGLVSPRGVPGSS